MFHHLEACPHLRARCAHRGPRCNSHLLLGILRVQQGLPDLPPPEDPTGMGLSCLLRLHSYWTRQGLREEGSPLPLGPSFELRQHQGFGGSPSSPAPRPKAPSLWAARVQGVTSHCPLAPCARGWMHPGLKLVRGGGGREKGAREQGQRQGPSLSDCRRDKARCLLGLGCCQVWGDGSCCCPEGRGARGSCLHSGF